MGRKRLHYGTVRTQPVYTNPKRLHYRACAALPVALLTPTGALCLQEEDEWLDGPRWAAKRMKDA
jgi:hypothetical protein